jgi:hypothetical protein
LPPALGPTIEIKVTNAFMEGLHRGCLVAAATALAVAFIVFFHLPAGRPQPVAEVVFET